ncbi:MAG: hypothetical protein GY941_24615 [Planctomycetes bacterium]|nr:hypothetical protein [Planctomycetota bacterium]
MKSEEVENLKKDIDSKINNNSSVKSNEFIPYWLKEDVRKTLWDHHDRKCCYCERKRELKRESDVEHYRPKAAIENEKNHPGYWWLAYDWENYFIACKPCNQGHKKNHFPLLPDGIRAESPKDSLTKEQPVLINPVEDDPEKFMDYDWKNSNGFFVKVVGLDKNGRGEKTIELMHLNRKELVGERAEWLSLLKDLADTMDFLKKERIHSRIDEIASKIEMQTRSRKSFAGFRRDFFRKRMLSEYVSTD